MPLTLKRPDGEVVATIVKSQQDGLQSNEDRGGVMGGSGAYNAFTTLSSPIESPRTSLGGGDNPSSHSTLPSPSASLGALTKQASITSAEKVVEEALQRRNNAPEEKSSCCVVL
jgi:hypothetical protein